MNTRDTRIGEITNVATGIENKYTTDGDVKKVYSDFASLLRIIQGKEIDFLKTGVRWHMSKGLRKYGKQIPWFLLFNYPNKLRQYENLKFKNAGIEDKKNKLPLNAFKSPSPMNELCEYICTWEKKHLIWDNSAIDTRCLILNNSLDLSDKYIIRQIRHSINSYANNAKRIFQNNENKEYGQLDILIDSYKKRLELLIPEEELLANYIIKVSYLNNSINKGLAWNGYGEYIIKNLSENSNPKKNISIVEVPYKTNTSYEYLGKYYEMKGCSENI
ncbi:MAG: hypothetical protein RR806_06200 [Oscillospiraceae bacterium]